MFPVIFCISSLRCDHDLSLFIVYIHSLSSYFTTKKAQHSCTKANCSLQFGTLVQGQAIVVTASVLPRSLLLLLRSWLLLLLASGLRRAVCCFLFSPSFLAPISFFPLSPPLPLRQSSGSLRPVIVSSLFGCYSGCSPDSSTPSRRPDVWSAVHTDPPCVSPPCHVSIRHIMLFLH